MRLVSAAKYASLKRRHDHVTRERDDAQKLAADRLSTINRLQNELSRLRDEKPEGPVPMPRLSVGDVELRRRLALAESTIRGLSERLDDLQASHVADTRELHDLRQGVAS
jgi:chromosome segregation ATPase